MLVQLHTSVYSVFPNFRDNVDDFIAVAEAEFDGRQIVVFDLSDIFGRRVVNSCSEEAIPFTKTVTLPSDAVI